VLVRAADRLSRLGRGRMVGSWAEQGQELTYAGVTVLHFDAEGQVVEHRDYDNHIERREPPYSGW
jgi:YD repeat-containing protein